MAIIDFARDDPRMITANFGLAEFQCPPTCGCNAQLIDDDLIKRLQTIRDKLGGKIKITSGYRCVKHNKRVGGGKASKHLYGVAPCWRRRSRKRNPAPRSLPTAPLLPAISERSMAFMWSCWAEIFKMMHRSWSDRSCGYVYRSSM